VPAAHPVHDDAPVAVANVPATQAKHVVAPVGPANCPAKQLWQAEDVEDPVVAR